MVPSEQIPWLQLIRLKGNINLLSEEDEKKEKEAGNYEILIFLNQNIHFLVVLMST